MADMAKTRARLLAAGMLCAVASLSSGCASIRHTMQPIQPELEARCQNLPSVERDRVHIFVINGFDPFHITNAEGLAQYLRELGFHDSRFRMMWTACSYTKSIHEIKAADPDARIVVIGYSMGVCFGRKLAKRLKEEGITVDLLLFLDAYTFNNRPEHSPEDATRIVNIMTEPRGMLGSTPLHGVLNFQYPDVRHYFIPTTQCIVEHIVREISDLADKKTINDE
jgi:hypothetical protein